MPDDFMELLGPGEAATIIDAAMGRKRARVDFEIPPATAPAPALQCIPCAGAGAACVREYDVKPCDTCPSRVADDASSKLRKPVSVCLRLGGETTLDGRPLHDVVTGEGDEARATRALLQRRADEVQAVLVQTVNTPGSYFYACGCDFETSSRSRSATKTSCMRCWLLKTTCAKSVAEQLQMTEALLAKVQGTPEEIQAMENLLTSLTRTLESHDVPCGGDRRTRAGDADSDSDEEEAGRPSVIIFRGEDGEEEKTERLKAPRDLRRDFHSAIGDVRAAACRNLALWGLRRKVLLTLHYLKERAAAAPPAAPAPVRPSTASYRVHAASTAVEFTASATSFEDVLAAAASALSMEPPPQLVWTDDGDLMDLLDDDDLAMALESVAEGEALELRVRS